MELNGGQYPLVPMQLGMVYHAWSGDRSGDVDLLQVVGALHERLDAGALHRAWGELVRENPALRMGFDRDESGTPRQFPGEDRPLDWEEIDWSGLEEPRRAEEWERFLAGDRLRGMDLGQPPLMRVTLIRMGECEYHLVWTVHHVVVDGRSCGLILSDVFQWYRRFCGDAVPRPAVRPDYREHLEWIGRQDFDASAPWWRDLLRGFSHPNRWPIRRGDHAIAGEYDYVEASRLLSGEQTDALLRCAREAGVTLNTLTQAAWALVAGVYCGDRDVVFGSIRACRRSSVAGADEMIGMFINTLPFRVRLDPDRRIGDWLSELRELQVRLRDFEHTPLFRIHGWSEMDDGTPLFDSLHVFESEDLNESLRKLGPEWEGRRFELRRNPTYPLVVAVSGGPRLRVRLEYHRRELDDGVMAVMLEHYLNALEALVRTPPHKALRELSLLNSGERRRVMSWGCNLRKFPPPVRVSEIIASRARERPRATAVVSPEGKVMSYADLEGRAGDLARDMAGWGLEAGMVVGICAARSADLIVGMLAVWKAGAAFVPMDPEYPEARLRHMLRDAGARWVLGDERGLGLLGADGLDGVSTPALGSLHWIHVAEESEDREPAVALSGGEGLPEAGRPAYVIFTSGSTGIPKGVVVRHAELGNHCHAIGEAFALEASDRVLQFASFSFDVAIEEIVPTLAAGAAVVMRDDAILGSMQEFRQWIADAGITVLNLPTGFWSGMVRDLGTPPPPWPPSVRLLIVGGEAVSAADFRLWRAWARSGVRWMNGYGPTEATITATLFEATPEHTPEPDRRHMPIGRPVANCRIYVVDPLENLCPPGIPGEIWIGGAGVAAGYLGREELTAERFRPDPWADEGGRCYRTGDRGAWHGAGCLEFLGRLDEQMKVRGYRIEPGEIEAWMGRFPGVSEAAVLAELAERGSGHGVVRLRGVLAVADPSAAPAPSAVKAFLGRHLPGYMVPESYAFTTSLPRLPNGKLDRRQLERFGSGREGARTDAADPPVTKTERRLAEIWRGLFGLDRVDRRDGFFALGGHSLLAMRLCTQIHSAFGVAVKIRDLVEHSRLAALAEWIEECRSVSTEPEEADSSGLEPVPRDGRLPLSSAQERLWFWHCLHPESRLFHVLQAWELEGDLNVDALQRAVDWIAARHEAVRTVLRESDGVPCQEILPPARVAIEDHDISSEPAEKMSARLREVLESLTARPFDLCSGPMMRWHCVRLAANRHVVAVVQHHMITDERSGEILAAELSAGYNAALNGEPPVGPELPIQYPDYTAWEQRHMKSPVAGRARAYWRNQFQSLPPALEILRRELPPASPMSVGTEYHLVSASTSHGLRRLARKENTTLFIVVLAAYAGILHYHSRQEDLVVGIPYSLRRHREIKDLLGLFLNLLPIRLEVTGETTTRDLIHGTARRVSEAMDHAEWPFERMVRDLRWGPDRSAQPIFQAFFAWQNEPPGSPSLNGLRVSPAEVPPPEEARYDLALYAGEVDGQLNLRLQYRRDLMSQEAMRGFLSRFERLLECMPGEADVPANHWSLMDPAEQQRILREWNRTERPWVLDSGVLSLWEQQANRTPDALAVIGEETSLTYAALNCSANRLAHRLIRQGVRPGVRVAIYLDRRPDLVVALLGVMKAGGVLVPMDPRLPVARNKIILEDAEPAVVIWHAGARLPEPEERFPRLALDMEAGELARESSATPNCNPKSDAPAYILYTSGSTGRPKGVMVSHGSFLNFILSMLEAPGLTPGDVVLSVTTISFDIALLEVFLPLTSGARVVVATEEVTCDGAALGRALERFQISCMQATPSHWRLLCDSGWSGKANLKMLCGGEALDIHLAGMLRQRGGELWNLYGPTETTIWSSREKLESPDPPISIGRPIANTLVRILNDAQRPVPAGVPGEIFIGGAGVALGYWRQPGLTDDRFLPDPFQSHPDARIYRTGDLGKWLPDGRILCLGRMDHQVKIRGFRVELGEIEAVLATHPTVLQAVVTSAEGIDRAPALTAYFVAVEAEAGTPDAGNGNGPLAGEHSEAAGANPEALRQYLAERLPDYMVPVYFVRLDAIPRTANGKIDRRALPVPGERDLVHSMGGRPPEGPTELALAEIWRELLGIESIGAGESFFALGGHSLLAGRLMSRVRRRFQVDYSMELFFRGPTIEAMAQFLEPPPWITAGGARGGASDSDRGWEEEIL